MSRAEALAAAAALAGVGIVEAQPPGEPFLHQVHGRALDARQAREVDHDAHAATFEDLVVFADTADRVQAVAEARAAGGLDCEPDCHGSGMLRELQREEFRGPRSRYDGQDLFVRRRLGPRYLDDDLPGPDRLARQARARLRDASAI